MSFRTKCRLVVQCIVAGAIVACRGDMPVTSPSVGDGPTELPRGPLKVPTIGQDPAPDSSGIFLGQGITLDFCIEQHATDVDVDGLDDICEARMAEAFRPELRFAPPPYDDTRGEPYWVARPDSSGHAWIGYLLGYYRDLGPWQWGCDVPFDLDHCHYGDAENIWLVLSFNARTQHWVLRTAYYSHHQDWNRSLFDGTHGYAAVEYPARPGGYPRAWVSQGKHANFFTQSDCNTARYKDYLPYVERCDHNTGSARVGGPDTDWSEYWNIGSESHPLLDGVASRNPAFFNVYGSSRIETFWTEKKFRGWMPETAGGESAGSYFAVLRWWGFMRPPPAPSPCGHWESQAVLDGNGEETGRYVNVWVPEECPPAPCTSGHWESQPVLDGNGEETGTYQMVWVPDPGCT